MKSKKLRYNCCVCSLAALCMYDAHNIISCLTVCPNCSNVSVPVMVDDAENVVVQYVTLHNVNENCVGAIMCAGYTTDGDYKCPECGFKKGRSPTGHTIERIERAQFMRRVRS